MKNKFLIVLGILIFISGTVEFFNASKQIKAFNIGAFIGMICLWLLAYWLIRLGLGKKGLIDK
jgi:isoprenylcysteine carboxyl methyltransferase (ICMT) family protein YpbQ